MAAKGGNKNDDGEGYVRFIMLETRGNSAALNQIAQAISQAVRPSVVQQVISPPAALPPRNIAAQGLEAISDDKPIIDVGMEEEADEPAPTRKTSAKKKLRMPEVIRDLDLTSGDVSFPSFFQEKNPNDHSKRYLVIAAWFKLHRQQDEIGIDHIYTCYRFLNLNVVPDVGNIFRSGKSQGWYHSGSQRGFYAINLVGLNKVNDMPNDE